MRLSVLAVSLILFFSQTVLAQHSSGGSSSSSGSSSAGSSGGGSHGGGYSGGGSSGGYSGSHSSGGSGGHISGGSGGHGSSGSSGGHVSGGSGSHSSGSHSSGSWLSHIWKSSHSGTSPVPAPGSPNIPRDASVPRPEPKPYFYSTVPGDSSEVHDHLLDQALAKIYLPAPAHPKADRTPPADMLKHRELNRVGDAKLKEKKGKAEPSIANKIRLRKHCWGKKCAPPPPQASCDLSHPIADCDTGLVWRLSEPVYLWIENDCGNLSRRLAQEEDRAETLRAQQQTVCTPAPLSSDCAAAAKEVAKLDAKLAKLREQYDRCVYSNLRHTMISLFKP